MLFIAFVTAPLFFYKMGFTNEEICGIICLLHKFNITVWVFFYVRGTIPFFRREQNRLHR